MSNLNAILKRHAAIQVVDYAPQYRDAVIAGAYQMHADSPYNIMPLDEDKVIRQLSACGSITPDRYFKLAVRDGMVLGAFYGCVQRTFFCDALRATDLGWWVLRERRGGAAAIVLLNDFVQWSIEQGAMLVMVGQSTGHNIEQTTKLYEHCGFRVVGYNTAKELHHG